MFLMWSNYHAMRQAGPTLGKMYYLLSYRLGEGQGAWSLLAILASLCFVSYLVANWLQKLEIKHCLLWRSYFCSYVCVCVCVVSQFDLSITKWNYLFVRCQSFSHIPNTSLRCSNQPLWKLNLMMGVNTTK